MCRISAFPLGNPVSPTFQKKFSTKATPTSLPSRFARCDVNISFMYRAETAVWNWTLNARFFNYLYLVSFKHYSRTGNFGLLWVGWGKLDLSERYVYGIHVYVCLAPLPLRSLIYSFMIFWHVIPSDPLLMHCYTLQTKSDLQCIWNLSERSHFFQLMKHFLIKKQVSFVFI